MALQILARDTFPVATIITVIAI